MILHILNFPIFRIVCNFTVFLNLLGDKTCSNSSAAKFCAESTNFQVLSSDIRPVQAQNSGMTKLCFFPMPSYTFFFQFYLEISRKFLNRKHAIHKMWLNRASTAGLLQFYSKISRKFPNRIAFGEGHSIWKFPETFQIELKTKV